MSALLDTTKTIVDGARAAESPIDHLRSAVSDMTREDVEQLAVAYLLSEMRKGSITPRAVKQQYKPRVVPPPTPEQLEARARIEEKLIQDEADSRTRFRDTMDKAFSLLKYEWHLEWTAELLDAEITLADGSTVKFGDATREQHFARAQVHRRNTLLNMESAVRHEKAIETLNKSGAPTLRAALHP